MNERDDERPRGETEPGAEPLSPPAERARAALRGSAPSRPDPAFRLRLREEFVSGAIEVTGAKKRRRQRGRKRGADVVAPIEPFPTRGRPPTFAWVAASLAAAAALILVFGTLNRGPTWWVTAARGDGSIRVDGQTIALDDRDAMRRRLVPGAEIEVAGNAELDLCCDGVVAVQLAPGTRMTLPPPPGRWLGRKTELYARGGELRVTTGPKFEGAQLAIMSPTAAVEVKGTTFAVIIEEAGTCVCVYDGTAVVGRLAGSGVGGGGTGGGRIGMGTDMQPVPSGMRRYIYKGERAPEMAGMRSEERMKLASFRESQRPWLEGPGSQE